MTRQLRGLDKAIYDATPIGEENAISSKNIHSALESFFKNKYNPRHVAGRICHKLHPMWVGRKKIFKDGRLYHSLFWKG